MNGNAKWVIGVLGSIAGLAVAGIACLCVSPGGAKCDSVNPGRSPGFTR